MVTMQPKHEEQRTNKVSVKNFFYAKHGRPRTMFSDWLLKTEEGNISYAKLKMLAQDRSRWSQ